jgi:hypothetical protein
MLLRQREVEAAQKLERGRVIDISATVLIRTDVGSWLDFNDDRGRNLPAKPDM